MSQSDELKCRVVRAGATFEGKQALLYNVGISAQSVGATGIHLQLATIPAGAAIDAASNASLASTSTSNTVAWVSTVDTTPPSVTINKASGQADPTSSSPIKYTVTFSEPVSGFDATPSPEHLAMRIRPLE